MADELGVNRISLRIPAELYDRLDEKRFRAKTTFQAIGIGLLKEWLNSDSHTTGNIHVDEKIQSKNGEDTSSHRNDKRYKLTPEISENLSELLERIESQANPVLSRMAADILNVLLDNLHDLVVEVSGGLGEKDADSGDDARFLQEARIGNRRDREAIERLNDAHRRSESRPVPGTQESAQASEITPRKKRDPA